MTAQEFNGTKKNHSMSSECRKKCIDERVRCATWNSVRQEFCQKNLQKCLERCLHGEKK